MVDLVTLAIPFFFLGMLVELIVGRVRKRPVFRGPDVAANLALGTMQTLVGVVGGVVIIGGYQWIWTHARLSTIHDDNAVAWVVLFVGLDFLYYWFHRAAHRINIAWASHAPHHSSEDFNLAVALRQGPLQPFISHVFYLPLAFAGFPLAMFAVVGSINTIIQFWVHTELVGKLGPLEWIFNTPSHHRVHHGCNGRYIDRNHGGVFIVWDRLFGTFEPEADRPVYGTVKQLTTWNPLAAAVAPFVDIARLARRAPRLRDKLLVWLKPPEWVPPGVSIEVPDVVVRPRFDARPSPAASRYVTPMFIVTLLAVVGFLFFGASHMSTSGVWLTAVWLTVSFASLGALLDGRAWAKPLEVARLLAVLPLAAAMFAA